MSVATATFEYWREIDVEQTGVTLVNIYTASTYSVTVYRNDTTQTGMQEVLYQNQASVVPAASASKEGLVKLVETDSDGSLDAIRYGELVDTWTAISTYMTLTSVESHADSTTLPGIITKSTARPTDVKSASATSPYASPSDGPTDPIGNAPTHSDHPKTVELLASCLGVLAILLLAALGWWWAVRRKRRVSSWRSSRFRLNRGPFRWWTEYNVPPFGAEQELRQWSNTTFSSSRRSHHSRVEDGAPQVPEIEQLVRDADATTEQRSASSMALQQRFGDSTSPSPLRRDWISASGDDDIGRPELPLSHAASAPVLRGGVGASSVYGNTALMQQEMVRRSSTAVDNGTEGGRKPHGQNSAHELPGKRDGRVNNGRSLDVCRRPNRAQAGQDGR